MRIRNVAIPTFLLAVGMLTFFGCKPVGLPPHAQWAKHSSNDGSVTAFFPNAPITSTRTENTSKGSIDIELFGCEMRSSALIIGVSPLESALDDSEINFVLDSARDDAFPDGEFLEREDIQLSGCPGKASLVKDKDIQFARTRIYYVPHGPTLVQVMCLGSLEFVNGSDAKFFLDSVTID